MQATLDISAPKAGKLKILVKEGETVGIGTKIAEVDESAVATATADPAPKAPEAPAAAVSQDKNFPSPAAAKILAEKGVDPSSVAGVWDIFS